MFTLFGHAVITEPRKYILLYQAPATMSAWVGSIVVCNQNSGNARIRFAIGSFPPKPEDFLYYDFLLTDPVRSHQITDLGIIPGESCVIWSDRPNVSFRLSGEMG
jgi:hypothetical protein